MRRHVSYALLCLALGTAACGEDEGSLSAEQQAVLQSLSESAPSWIEESPGLDGAVADIDAAPAATGIQFAPGDSFHAPAFWGRFRRAHRPSHDRLVEVTGDSAWVLIAVHFDGVLRVDTTFDGIANAGTKPLRETARQQALFVRDTAAPRGWRLAGISVRRFRNTAVGERTVNITSVTVIRNSGTPAVLADPEALLNPAALTSASVGDTLTVVVAVTNSTGTDLIPPTQMFIHVRHFDPGTDLWARMRMQRLEDGTFQAQWVVRRPGAAIIGVDALDSQSLTTQSGDDYRSDLWAVPVRVE